MMNDHRCRKAKVINQPGFTRTRSTRMGNASLDWCHRGNLIGLRVWGGVCVDSIRVAGRDPNMTPSVSEGRKRMTLGNMFSGRMMLPRSTTLAWFYGSGQSRVRPARLSMPRPVQRFWTVLRLLAGHAVLSDTNRERSYFCSAYVKKTSRIIRFFFVFFGAVRVVHAFARVTKIWHNDMSIKTNGLQGPHCLCV